MDSLLSIVQMPRGVPVATVAVDNATNAALLAARILALSNPELAAKVAARTEEMKQMALDADARVRQAGEASTE
jgi:phosphoribosylaminoimidazole carboxylase PurE protein